MKDSADLEIKDKWLLTIIDMTPHVASRTRLQKLVLLSYRYVIDEEECFDDWQPDRFGGYSPGLMASLEKLEKHGYIESSRAVTKSGQRVMRYQSLRKAKAEIKNFVRDRLPELEKLRFLLRPYSYRPLKALLIDAYRICPKLTVNNEIMDSVNEAMDRLEYDTIEHESTILGPAPPPVIPLEEQYPSGDLETRMELARSIGLERVPDRRSNSTHELCGILADYMDTENFDPVEAVKEVRGG